MTVLDRGGKAAVYGPTHAGVAGYVACTPGLMAHSNDALCPDHATAHFWSRKHRACTENCGWVQSRFFLAFDMDGDELISFHEYLLVLVFLGVHVEVRHRCSPDHRVLTYLQPMGWAHTVLHGIGCRNPSGKARNKVKTSQRRKTALVLDRATLFPSNGCTATQDITTAMFDADDSGFIDKEEFESLFETLRASRPGAEAGAGRTGFNAGPA